MSPEMVERVAEQIRAAVYAAGDEGPSVAAARYALALAERAAMEAFRDGWFSARGSVPVLGLSVRPTGTEAAVQRAVEGA